jgi:hypothetical protein
VGGVIEIERFTREPDHPPARRGTPRAREQLCVSGRVRKPDVPWQFRMDFKLCLPSRSGRPLE